jgi:hypothetical protein
VTSPPALPARHDAHADVAAALAGFVAAVALGALALSLTFASPCSTGGEPSAHAPPAARERAAPRSLTP